MSKSAAAAARRGVLRSSPFFEKCEKFDDAGRIQRAGLYSFFRVVESAQEPEVSIGGRRLLMLGSNNYLGLTNDPRVKEAAIEAIRKYGSGCAGSRFLNGTLDLHVRLEERLAEFMRQEAAVVFATGFQVNLGAISCLVGKGDTVYLDKQDHACIIDGARLSFGEICKFRHNDVADLRRQMRNDTDARGRLIVVDGVFSMEGDIAPLPEIVAVAREFDAALMVDDAHGIGVMGRTGRGTAEHFGLEQEVDLVMGTFSKSMASVGGFIAGDAVVIDYIKHRARSMTFSAAPPPSSVAAANTRFFADGLRSLGFDTGESQTPVVPVVVGEDVAALRMVQRLHEEEVFVNCVISPATPPGRALIRTSLMATHTREQLSRALEVIGKVGREVGVLQPATV
jgi:7-keto-8-aminopelargonate synthetase-like enzyme